MYIFCCFLFVEKKSKNRPTATAAEWVVCF